MISKELNFDFSYIGLQQVSHFEKLLYLVQNSQNFKPLVQKIEIWAILEAEIDQDSIFYPQNLTELFLEIDETVEIAILINFCQPRKAKI